MDIWGRTPRQRKAQGKAPAAGMCRRVWGWLETRKASAKWAWVTERKIRNVPVKQTALWFGAILRMWVLTQLLVITTYSSLGEILPRSSRLGQKPFVSATRGNFTVGDI